MSKITFSVPVKIEFKKDKIKSLTFGRVKGLSKSERKLARKVLRSK